MRHLLAVLALVVFIAPPSSAQFAAGSLGVFGDEEGAITQIDVTPGVVFSVYVVAFDPPGGVQDYRFELLGLPQNTFVIDTQLLAPGLDVDAESDPFVFVVDGDGCAAGDVVPLVRMDLLLLDPPFDEAVFAARTSNYDDCGGIERDFGVAASGEGLYPDGALILNPSGSGCCPGIQHDFDMPTVGVTGTQAIVPFRYDAVPLLCRTTCIPVYSYAVGGVLQFNPDKLRLVDVTVADGAPAWDITLTELAPGEFDFRMVAPAQNEGVGGINSLPDLEGEALLNFEFEYLQAGSTVLTVQSPGVCRISADHTQSTCGTDPSDYTSGPPVLGTVSIDPIPADVQSFGTLKSRYDQD